ncbi:high-affinity nickel-transport protein-domain-containing protein [Coniochaeta sp. 2T2.1]|nr:high-affinity nickel-transport protein-domain-containing protein [Coniochaeta sp. 2T2.1]
MSPLRLPRLPSKLRFTIPHPKCLSGIPPAAIRIISLLILVNILVWVAAGIIAHYNPKLVGACALSFALGLRHALDADHISAIDLMTRRLIASGQRPVTVGTWFSLGHSTIVIVTCIVVAATSGALREKFGDFTRVGNIIGTSVSAAFLLLLSVGNGWVLWRLVVRLRGLLAAQRLRDGDGVGENGVGEGEGGDGTAANNNHLGLDGVGFMSRVFRKLFVIVDRPWKMLPLGMMFGLGFDTSSEIAILGIASIHGMEGTSLWLILIFPALFTAGMCLVDTTDGALMMALYTSKAFSRDQIAILYYSVVLTGITVFVSAFIGIIQVLSLAQNIAEPEGKFWDGVSAIGDHFDIIGGSICGLFLVVGLGSVLVYKPWRRRMDRAGIMERVPSSDGEDGRVAQPDLISPVAESFVEVTAAPDSKAVDK